MTEVGIIKVAGIGDTVSGMVDGAKDIAGNIGETAKSVVGDIGSGLANATNTQKVGYGAGGGAALGALITLFQKNPSLMKALRNAGIGAGVGAAGVAGVNALQNNKEEPETDGFSTGAMDKAARIGKIAA